MRSYLTAALMAALVILSGCDSNGGGDGESGPTVYDVYSYPTYVLTPAMEDSLAYMWHEEKLAGDIYLALNALFPNAKMQTIGSQGEATHELLVRNLVEKYDLNVTNLVNYGDYYTQEELDAMPDGVFAIGELQTLYDTLYDEGNDSAVDALKVGCKVEVLDITDLTEYIATAGESQDLVDVFTYLREGSYKHYWAFDGELKTLGVSEGCCAVGVVDGVDYCHPEYPK